MLTELKMEGSSGKSLRQALAATRRGSTVSVPGVYAGWIHGFLFGDAFETGLNFAMGQTHAQRHSRKVVLTPGRSGATPVPPVSATLGG